ncbi:hypothetical protein [Loktanella sp. Alg231-35]|uniref:hypothetical protein n=1 Tax=Loktanella sp. Alg231-35 TaxID=1922220 RepID=UPI000D5529AC|nr:hypothetical protein [Loktanella sp. Alg231-35]
MADYDDFSKMAIKAAITTALGRGAKISPHDFSNPTVLTKTLQDLTEQFGDIFRVFWAEHAPASFFCLSGFEPTPIVCSRSYLSLSADVRRVFSEDAFKGELREQVAQQTIYRIMAEMSLLHGDPDLGALLLARGESLNNISFIDHKIDWRERWRELEVLPIGEATLTLWMGPVVHEIGHVVSRAGKLKMFDDALDPDVIADALTHTLNQFPYPDEVKAQILKSFQDPSSGSCVSLPHLQEEARADLFALLSLLPATQRAMEDPDIGGYSPVHFYWELMIFFNCITLVDRCRNMVIAAAMTEVDGARVHEDLIVRPVAHATRSLLLEAQLQNPELYIDPTVPDFDHHADGLLTDFARTKEEIVSVVDSVDRAVGVCANFALFHDRRPSEPTIFSEFRDSLLRDGANTFSSVPAFFELAQDMGKATPFVCELAKIQIDPKAPLAVATDSQKVFIIHGYVVGETFVPVTFDMTNRSVLFVFLFDSEAEQLFAAHNRRSLPPDRQLIGIKVMAHRWERVVPTLREQIEIGEVSVIGEGTKAFSDHFDALKTVYAEAGT